MFGAIAGDVIGSYYEHYPTKRLDFDLFPEQATFTDDTVAV
jgi:ADP-ribosylglycohydrolase